MQNIFKMFLLVIVGILFHIETVRNIQNEIKKYNMISICVVIIISVSFCTNKHTREKYSDVFRMNVC